MRFALEAREVGLALLEERVHGFLGLRGCQALEEDAALLRDLLLHRAGMRRLHQALGEPDRFRRQLREAARRGLRGCEKVGFRHHGGDDADLARLVRAEGLPEKQELGGALVAAEERQQVGGAELRHEAELYERQLEARARRGVHEVAMQEQRGADADGGPADGGDYRLGERRQHVEEAPARGFLARWALQEVRDVVAGGEAVLGAMDQQGTHIAIGVGSGECFRHLHVHLGGDRVLLLGSRELDARDTFARFSPYQACSPSSAGAARAWRACRWQCAAAPARTRRRRASTTWRSCLRRTSATPPGRPPCPASSLPPRSAARPTSGA